MCNCQISLVTFRSWLCGGLDLSRVENGHSRFLQGDAFEVERTFCFGATTANAQLLLLKSATREKTWGHKHSICLAPLCHTSCCSEASTCRREENHIAEKYFYFEKLWKYKTVYQICCTVNTKIVQNSNLFLNPMKQKINVTHPL